MCINIQDKLHSELVYTTVSAGAAAHSPVLIAFTRRVSVYRYKKVGMFTFDRETVSVSGVHIPVFIVSCACIQVLA